ncbi:MlaD family protein [Opitutus sp. ER46]|uniref:PqiB family protein n=1 Tax=Opitutus sp. ER46 TaxID=2161864 RepID=UPI000D319829|nr:MlaD family protein [Opitutus sp. ER46]PTX97818.1 hypothetical protein DB354_05950 [Opitutus sp. ER46]
MSPTAPAPAPTSPPAPRLSRRPALPLVWVVPLVALAVAGWMLLRQFRDHGPTITIEFSRGAGVEAGKTELEHKGVAIGVVTAVRLKDDLSGVILDVRLTKTGAAVARTGSEFWIVHPEVSFAGIRGLETLVSGVRLQVRPGTGKSATHFRGLDRPPAIDDPESGRAFVLRANRLGGLRPGAPVYFRGVKIGLVETTRLASDATAALIRVRIYTPYVDLVRTNSQFWNVGGISFRLGFTGAEVKSTTLQSLLLGGVSLGTPDGELAPPALEGTEYVLHEDPEKEWLQWRPRIPITPVESTPKTEPAEAPQLLGQPVPPAP